jgi:hypothetical protein
MQKTVSLSTAESEYYAAPEMGIEILYLCTLLQSMGFPQEPDTPVYEDKTARIEWRLVGCHVTPICAAEPSWAKRCVLPDP